MDHVRVFVLIAISSWGIGCTERNANEESAFDASATDAWCAAAPVPAGWNRRETVGRVVSIEAPVEIYGGQAELNLSRPNNFVSAGISIGRAGYSGFEDLIMTEADIANGSWLPSNRNDLQVEGFRTLTQDRTFTQGEAHSYALVADNGTSSAHCYDSQAPILGATCDFFIVSRPQQIRIRSHIPFRMVTSISAIMRDIEPALTYISTNCGAEEN